MSDDARHVVVCEGCGAENTPHLKCSGCGCSVCDSCTDNQDQCIDCAPDPDDEFVTCHGCGEDGYAGRDGMFTFNCKVCGKEICETCSTNNLCETCEAQTTGVVTVHFR